MHAASAGVKFKLIEHSFVILLSKGSERLTVTWPRLLTEAKHAIGRRRNVTQVAIQRIAWLSYFRCIELETFKQRENNPRTIPDQTALIGRPVIGANVLPVSLESPEGVSPIILMS
jgi:hypothetical protein